MYISEKSLLGEEELIQDRDQETESKELDFTWKFRRNPWKMICSKSTEFYSNLQVIRSLYTGSQHSLGQDSVNQLQVLTQNSW